MLGSRSILKSTATASLLLASGLVVLAGGAATADTPPETGCPSNGQPGGWLYLSVSDLVQQGYLNVGANIDLDADGYICGKPVSPALQALICAERPGGVCPVPVIYYFRDNDLSAAD